MADAPVLVVGGRTTGLMMASELARRGIDVRIVDASPGIDPHCRANLLHSRTLEIFQGLGIADAATEGSFEERGMRVYANGKPVGAQRRVRRVGGIGWHVIAHDIDAVDRDDRAVVSP